MAQACHSIRPQIEGEKGESVTYGTDCEDKVSKIFIIQAIEHFFRIYIASSKHEEGWENLR